MWHYGFSEGGVSYSHYIVMQLTLINLVITVDTNNVILIEMFEFKKPETDSVSVCV